MGEDIPNLKKTTMLDQPYQRAIRTRMGMQLAPVNSICKVYIKKQSRICGSEILVWADHVHGCARAARNQGHNLIRDWRAGVLTNCADRVQTAQFVSEYERALRLRADIRAIPDVGGYATYYDVVVTSPFTTGMRESQESEPKGHPHEDRVIRAAEKEKEKKERERQETAARYSSHPHRASGLRGVWKIGRKSGRSTEAGGEAKTGKA